MFGSAVRDDFGPNSDIDFLVDYDPERRYTIRDIMNMKDEMKQMLGRGVDLVSRSVIESGENYLRRELIFETTEIIYDTSVTNIAQTADLTMHNLLHSRDEFFALHQNRSSFVTLRRNENVRMLDMLCRARRVVKSTRGVDYVTFAADTILQDSVLYNIQNIGEAAAHIGTERQKRHPEISWSKVNVTRNIATHEYNGIDYPAIWSIVQGDIPELINNLEVILKREEKK